MNELWPLTFIAAQPHKTSQYFENIPSNISTIITSSQDRVTSYMLYISEEIDHQTSHQTSTGFFFFIRKFDRFYILKG